MSIQKFFSSFHKNIRVENNDDLRDKRDILVSKIRDSLKKAGHPLPDSINQGSYIYGVGVIPLGDVEYDIDVGLEFPIQSSAYEAKTVRKWVYDAVVDHTDQKAEDRGPCIRVRYAKGFHVDLVVYAKHKDSEYIENHQLARKDNSWRPTEPKKLKAQIFDARKAFNDTKDSSGSDQLQRITRYLKRWNDLEHPEDSPDKPFGLATLLLVIKYLNSPVIHSSGTSDDLAALINVARAVTFIPGRIIVTKPTQEFEDVFEKLSADAMDRLKERFVELLDALESARDQESDDAAAQILRTQFGDDFPASMKRSDESLEFDEAVKSEQTRKALASDMKAVIQPNDMPPRIHIKDAAKPWKNM